MLRTMVIAILMTGCINSGITSPRGPNFKPDDDGYSFCREVSDSARVRASNASGWGWFFSALGAASVSIGTAYPLAKDSNDLDFSRKLASTSAVIGGGMLVLVGQAILKRSDAASKLAAETASTLGSAVDNKPIGGVAAGQKCLVALGAWESSRADATALASKLLDKQKAETEKANDEKDAAQQGKKDAETKAATATQKAEELQKLLLLKAQ